MGETITSFSLAGTNVEKNEIKLGSIIAVPKSICYPASLGLMADFNINEVFDATYAKGSMVATPVNSPISLDGLLLLEGGFYPNLGKYVDYNAVTNINNGQTGCMRVKYIPNYNPGTVYFDMKLFALLDSDSNKRNLIEVCFVNNSNEHGVVVNMNDKDGTPILEDYYLGDWIDYTISTTHEFELDWDLNTGIIRFFADGVQMATDITDVQCLRDNNVNIIRVGNGWNPSSYSSSGKFDEFRVFNSVIHSTNYIPGDDEPSLPSEYNNYEVCIGGICSRAESIYYGQKIPDMTLIDSNIVWAWKII